MKENTSFVVLYTGNHTGKVYENDLVGLASTEDEAKELLNEIIKEDLETYSESFKNKSMTVEYDCVKRDVTTNDLPCLLPAYPVKNYKVTIKSKDIQYTDDEILSYRIEKITYLTL